MSCPQRIADDGRTVTLDLHGCPVDEGLYVVRRTLQEACRRGRAKVDVIHGSSTSMHSRYDRTIKNELMAQLEGGAFREWASGHTMDASGGQTTIWVHLGANATSDRIRAKHVSRPGPREY